jgi:VIT1/CCC1 family predicted Fe2+/Mn2+ transporter
VDCLSFFFFLYFYSSSFIQKSFQVRDMILGVNDGLVSTFLVVAGVVGGGISIYGALLTAIASAVAGAISMAIGEYIATKSQGDVDEWEIELEREHLHYHRDKELQELRGYFEDAGLKGPLCEAVLHKVAPNEEALLLLMRTFQFGNYNPGLERSPVQAMLFSAATFAAGALPTVLPFLIFTSTFNAMFSAAILVILSLFGVGAFKSRLTQGDFLLEGGENCILGIAGACISYGVGSIFDYYQNSIES